MYLFADHEALWGPPAADWPPAVCLSDRFDLHALISPQDILWASKWKWGYKWAAGVKAAKDNIYACRQMRLSGKKLNLWLHREICWRAHGAPPSERHMADHLNGDSLDCRRENLRWATPSQNSKNRYGLLARELEMRL